MDDGIGRVLAQLETSGVADDTIVWFFSDNGGIGRIRGNNAPLHGAKLSVYEGGVRVPAAVRWPGHIDGGRKVETPLMNIDVLPTLLSLVGAKTELAAVEQSAPPIDGVDMSAALLHAPSAAPQNAKRDRYFFHAQDGPDREQLAVTTPKGWKLLVVGPDVTRDAGYKSPQHRIELYNVLDDPNETRNLAVEKPKLVNRLAAKLIAFRKSEPADAMPLQQKPADFQPPKKWRNAEKKTTEATGVQSEPKDQTAAAGRGGPRPPPRPFQAPSQ